MQLNSYELAVYTACLNEERTMAGVAEYLYPDNTESVRTQISRKKALDILLNNGLLIPKRDGRWEYISDEQKAYKIFKALGLPDEVAEAKVDSFDWVERIAEREKPQFHEFDRFLRNALILDYLEQNRGLDKQDLELVEQLEA